MNKRNDNQLHARQKEDFLSCRWSDIGTKCWRIWDKMKRNGPEGFRILGVTWPDEDLFWFGESVVGGYKGLGYV